MAIFLWLFYEIYALTYKRFSAGKKSIERACNSLNIFSELENSTFRDMENITHVAKHELFNVTRVWDKEKI